MKTIVLVTTLFISAGIYAQGIVCITIDDVPNTRLYKSLDNKNPLLVRLDSLNIPACIFINENKVFKDQQEQENLIHLENWIGQGSIELGNHTFAHSRYSAVGFSAFTEDIKKGHNLSRALAQEYGKTVPYFRFPYNDRGIDADQHQKIDSFLSVNNYVSAPFTVESSDWMYNYIYEYYLSCDSVIHAEEIGNLYVEKTMEYFDFFDTLSLQNYERKIPHIYLCHDNRINADYLGSIITALAEKDYTFVSLDEVLQDPLYDQTDHYHKKWGVSWLYRWMENHEERLRWMRKEPDLNKIEALYKRILVEKNAINPSHYTSYFSGNRQDTLTEPQGGLVLMGGGPEDDEAMRWFLRRAQGGDILVLRASGSDGYNSYLFDDLDVPINSVETIVFEDVSANEDPYILERIKNAEAIWFAGGNQWKYVEYWRNSPVDSLINVALSDRNIVIGGTSAGMAILGGSYFSAEHGTITSEDALNEPLGEQVSIDTQRFLLANFMDDVITDTHYSNRDRKGRHVAFMASRWKQTESKTYGIGCDEGVAVCIDEEGMARVFGPYTNKFGHAYFIQSTPEISAAVPEICASGRPLTWHRESKALTAYRLSGTPTGSGYFDLSTWNVGTGGQWFYWSVDNGLFLEKRR